MCAAGERVEVRGAMGSEGSETWKVGRGETWGRIERDVAAGRGVGRRERGGAVHACEPISSEDIEWSAGTHVRPGRPGTRVRGNFGEMRRIVDVDGQGGRGDSDEGSGGEEAEHGCGGVVWLWLSSS